MYRASIRDLQQPIALFFRQLAQKCDLHLNADDHRGWLFAMLAVSSVAFRVRQGGPYSAQGPSFAIRIRANRLLVHVPNAANWYWYGSGPSSVPPTSFASSARK
jgi:hypothetical protein